MAASFAGGNPPGPHAGDMSPLTELLRPALGLSSDQCHEARRLRRAGRSIKDIATEFGTAEENVREALAAMRTRKVNATRRTLNVTLAAHEFVSREAVMDEPRWQTIDRLLIELTLRRALAGAPLTSGDDSGR